MRRLSVLALLALAGCDSSDPGTPADPYYNYTLRIRHVSGPASIPIIGACGVKRQGSIKSEGFTPSITPTAPFSRLMNAQLAACQIAFDPDVQTGARVRVTLLRGDQLLADETISAPGQVTVGELE